MSEPACRAEGGWLGRARCEDCRGQREFELLRNVGRPLCQGCGALNRHGIAATSARIGLHDANRLVLRSSAGAGLISTATGGTVDGDWFVGGC